VAIDPYQLQTYHKRCEFLPDINNEGPEKNPAYKKNMLSLTNFAMVYSEVDQVSTVARTHHAPRTTHHAPRTTHHAPRTTHHAPRTTHHDTTTKMLTRIFGGWTDGQPAPVVRVRVVCARR
jgi:hypothetical protein